MALPDDTDQAVLEVIMQLPGSTLDDIVRKCSELTWNQIFIIIDRLSRRGVIKLTPKGKGLYSLHPSKAIPSSGKFSGNSHPEALPRESEGLRPNI